MLPRIACRGPLALLGVVLMCLSSCGRPAKRDGDAPTPTASGEPKALSLRDDTRALLLTWVDSAGDFHVTDRVDQVPPDRRDRVRVVDVNRNPGPSDQVQVADLRTRRADGTYPISTLSRNQWEELGASRRKQRLEALAPLPASKSSTEPAASGPVTVVLYGAAWCGACREAKKYLQAKGISVLEKDVDLSPVVQAELRAKLTQAGQPPTSSIPVLDVNGRILVGFSPKAIDAALAAASRSARD